MLSASLPTNSNLTCHCLPSPTLLSVSRTYLLLPPGAHFTYYFFFSSGTFVSACLQALSLQACSTFILKKKGFLVFFTFPLSLLSYCLLYNSESTPPHSPWMFLHSHSFCNPSQPGFQPGISNSAVLIRFTDDPITPLSTPMACLASLQAFSSLFFLETLSPQLLQLLFSLAILIINASSFFAGG